MLSKILTAAGLCFLIFVACRDHDQLCPPNDAPAQGFVSARWTITLDTGRRHSCALAGASSVALTLHPQGGGNDITLTSSCVASMISASVSAGVYDVTPSLLAADGGVIVTAAPQATVTVSAGQAAILEPISFAPTARTGELALRIAAVGQGTNCQTANGRPISGAVIILKTIDGRCVDAAFARSRDGVFVGKYLSSCEHPVLTTCFEQDETLSIDDGLTAGQYAISVGGLSGSAICFQAQEALTVGGGITNHATIQLNALSGLGC